MRVDRQRTMKHLELVLKGKLSVFNVKRCILSRYNNLIEYS